MSVALALLLALATRQGTDAPPAPAPQASEARRDDPARVVAAWREALELDLPAEVLADGPQAVAPGGPLAAEGEAVALVARALFDAGREEEARALLDGARPRAATAVHVALERARERLEEDRLEDAVALLADPEDPARTRWPDVAQSWLLLGRALVRQDRWQDAVPFLRRYVELDRLGEGAYPALHMLSQAALRRGDGAAAEELVKRAYEAGQWRAYYRVRLLQVREKPDEPLPRLGLAQLFLQAGDDARAREVLDELTRSCPDFAPGWFHLAELRRKEQRWDEALAAYDRALELDPGQSLARYNRAILLLRAGDGERARADLETLVSGPRASDPLLIGAHLALARLLLAAGEDEAAAARYARYRELGGTAPLRP